MCGQVEAKGSPWGQNVGLIKSWMQQKPTKLTEEKEKAKSPGFSVTNLP